MEIQKSKTFQDVPKSFGFLGVLMFWIFVKIVYLVSAL